MLDFNKKLNVPKGLDDSIIFGERIESSVETNKEKTEISIHLLKPYKNNPFKLYEGERLEEMKRSISAHGILQPILVREVEGSDTYEILSGHNRYNVAKLLSETDERFKTVPVRILKGIDDVTAELIVSESNVMQRSLNDLLPSEKAFVIATYYSAEKKQGKRTDLINKVNEILGKEDSQEIATGKEKAATEFNLSPFSIAKYSKINTLTKEIKELLDDKKLDVDTAYNLSFKMPEEQEIITKFYLDSKAKLNRTSSLEIKKLDEVTEDKLKEIFKKKNGKGSSQVASIIKKYLPNKSKEEVASILNSLLEDYIKKRSD